MVYLPKKQTQIRTSLPYCLYKVDSRFFRIGDALNTKIRITKQETTPNRRTYVSKNIEAIRDRWGIEAHSDVVILTDRSFADLDKAETFVLQILNDFVKIYRRYDSEAVHLVSLIREDFFGFSLTTAGGGGTFSIPLGGGIKLRDPMQTQRVSDSIEKFLGEKKNIPLWAELLMNAEQYLYQGDYRHSILESVIALEIVLSDFITKRCVAKGISATEAKKFITDVGVTGNIEVSLKILLDPPITCEELTFRKCKAGITIRNKIVHEGRKGVTKTEVEDTLTEGRKLIETLLPTIDT